MSFTFNEKDGSGAKILVNLINYTNSSFLKTPYDVDDFSKFEVVSKVGNNIQVAATLASDNSVINFNYTVVDLSVVADPQNITNFKNILKKKLTSDGEWIGDQESDQSIIENSFYSIVEKFISIVGLDSKLDLNGLRDSLELVIDKESHTLTVKFPSLVFKDLTVDLPDQQQELKTTLDGLTAEQYSKPE